MATWNSLQVTGGEKDFKDKVHTQWPKLTDQDVLDVTTQQSLGHFIAKRYEIALGRAELQVDEWLKKQR